jgi:hypothetical protein
MIQLLLLVIALVLAGLAAFGVGGPRFNLLAAAVAFYVGSELVPHLA